MTAGLHLICRDAQGVACDERGRSHEMAWSSGVVKD